MHSIQIKNIYIKKKNTIKILNNRIFKDFQNMMQAVL